MANPDSLREVRLTDREARTAIARALQLEERSGSLSIAEIASGARAVGISDEALIQALSEVLRERQSEDGVPISKSAKLQWHAWIPVTVLAVVGGIGAALLGAGAGLLPVGIMGMASAFRAFDHRRDGTQRRLQLEIGALWSSFGLVASTTLPRGSDAIEIVSVMWLSSAAVGGAIVGSKKWFRSHKQPATAPDAAE